MANCGQVIIKDRDETCNNEGKHKTGHGRIRRGPLKDRGRMRAD